MSVVEVMGLFIPCAIDARYGVRASRGKVGAPLGNGTPQLASSVLQPDMLAMMKAVSSLIKFDASPTV